jgi:outer membrane protein
MTVVMLVGLRRVLSVTVLTAAITVPAFAQTAPKPAAPAAPKPAAPAAPKPASPPAAAAPAAAQAPAPAPVVPFPEGAKVAFIDIQRIIAESKEGQSASGKVKALNDRKVAELNEKNKALQNDQQKLQSGAGVLSDSAREDLQRKIERQNTDIERATQDAQKELQDLQQQLQLDFQRKLNPILGEVAQERGLHLVFSAGDAGLAWAHAGLDITPDVIKRFDAKK